MGFYLDHCVVELDQSRKADVQSLIDEGICLGHRFEVLLDKALAYSTNNSSTSFLGLLAAETSEVRFSSGRSTKPFS